MCVKFISKDFLWETFLWKLPLPYHVRIEVIFSIYMIYVLLNMYFKDKSTALQSKLNKVNNTGTQMQETFIIWNNFF